MKLAKHFVKEHSKSTPDSGKTNGLIARIGERETTGSEVIEKSTTQITVSETDETADATAEPVFELKEASETVLETAEPVLEAACNLQETGINHTEKNESL